MNVPERMGGTAGEPTSIGPLMVLAHESPIFRVRKCFQEKALLQARTVSASSRRSIRGQEIQLRNAINTWPSRNDQPVCLSQEPKRCEVYLNA